MAEEDAKGMDGKDEGENMSEKPEDQAAEEGGVALPETKPLGYVLDGEGNPVPLPGVHSLFLTDTTVERVGMTGITEEKPSGYVEKDVILKDASFRGKISDFYEIKGAIEKADYDLLLVRMNVDNIYGDDNNFEVATSKEAAAEWELMVKWDEMEAKRLEEEKASGGKQKRKKKTKKPVPVSKPWESYGSEQEIMDGRLKSTRELITVSFSRPRREFNQGYDFSDKDAQELWNSSQMECRPYKDVNFDLRRMEFDASSQCYGGKRDVGVQATRLPLMNKCIQYEPRTFSNDDAMVLMESEGLKSFLKNIEAVCDDALQQNEVMDIFEDDFAALAEEDSAPGNRSENMVSEYQSFTHLTYSKNKLVSAIDWIPNRKGVVAVACTEPLSFDERVEVSGRVKTSAVLIWNFKDPIHPQCVLESPFDVMCFRFNKHRPELAAGGMYNGQVILWDTAPASKQLKTRSEDEEEKSIPVIKYLYLNTIESSHTHPITDLCWLPKNIRVTAEGKTERVDGNDNFMFLTTAADGRVNFWDIKPKKDKKGETLWAPVFSIGMTRLDVSGNLGCIKLNLGSAESTKFFCSSHDGEVAYADYEKPEGVEHPDYTKTVTDGHSGPVMSLDRSPFFPDIMLSVGDWTFKVWKEGITTPIFSSPFSTTYLSGGCWSPTRPGVLYTARQDGVLEIWDLLDRSHEPSMTVTVSSTSITALEFLREQSSQSMQQLLAVGDKQGILHIMELPRNLRRAAPSERAVMRAFFERELKRVNKMGTGKGDNEELGIDGSSTTFSGEEMKADVEYDAELQEVEYRKLEQEFMQQLGLEIPQQQIAQEVGVGA